MSTERSAAGARSRAGRARGTGRASGAIRICLFDECELTEDGEHRPLPRGRLSPARAAGAQPGGSLPERRPGTAHAAPEHAGRAREPAEDAHAAAGHGAGRGGGRRRHAAAGPRGEGGCVGAGGAGCRPRRGVGVPRARTLPAPCALAPAPLVPSLAESRTRASARLRTGGAGGGRASGGRRAAMWNAH